MITLSDRPFQVIGAAYENDRLANSVFDAGMVNSDRAADRVDREDIRGTKYLPFK